MGTFSVQKYPKIYISVVCNLAVRSVFLLHNNSKNLDPSYKVDLDFWDFFRMEKLLFYS